MPRVQPFSLGLGAFLAFAIYRCFADGWLFSVVSFFSTFSYVLLGIVAFAVLAAGYLYLKGTRSQSSLPKTMKVLLLTKHPKEISTEASDYTQCFRVEERPVPTPRPGQVLVKVERSPVNPSDLSTLQGSYNASQRAELPCTIGFEASGTVVASGGGIVGGLRMGKRVACVSKKTASMWAEYTVVPAMQCIPLPDNVSFTEGCSVFVNPMTAIAFIEIAQKSKQRSILLTAANSALCKMVIRLARRNNIRTIAIVRREQYRAGLLTEGASHVVVTSEEGWEQGLKDICKEERCKIGFDAVAGPAVGTILKSMDNGASLYVYGGLSQQPCGNVRATELIFRDSAVRGFWLTGYLRSKGPIGLLKWVRLIQKHLKDDLATDYQGEYSLSEIVQAVTDYKKNMSAGKVIIAPSKPSQLGDVVV